MLAFITAAALAITLLCSCLYLWLDIKAEKRQAKAVRHAPLIDQATPELKGRK